MSLRFAYNTNGLQSHRLGDAIDFLGEVGYHGVALTLDPCHLDPLEAGPSLIAGVGRRLRQARLACVIETGGRFLLDPRREELPELRLTLDVAHVSVCAEEGTPPEALRAEASHLTLVHLEDAPARVHEHLPLGEGDLDLPATLAALVELNFQSLVAVELSRHSHAAHELVPETLAKLKAALPS